MTKRSPLILLPLTGILVFILLYIVATRYYPGGTQWDAHSRGFSWTGNYWCNLLNAQGINGEPNPGRPIAIGAMVVLCLSLSIFWWIFPDHAGLPRSLSWVIRSSGVLAMTTGLFLFLPVDHDAVTNLASLFGLVATLGTLAGVYRKRWKSLFWFGMLNLVLVIVNNILYYNPNLIVYLPLIQKLTFASFLSWVWSVCYRLYKRN